MKIAVFGLGYVGITAAACLSKQGHRVVGIDISESKVRSIQAGRAPIVEPDVPELIAYAVEQRLLSATTEIGAELHDADVAFVCVGTPSSSDGSHNMSYIAEVSRQIAASIEPGGKRLTVVYRSTIAPGTLDTLVASIFAEQLGRDFATSVELVYNPEFLREGSAVADYFAPPKIVIGTAGARPSAAMDQIYEGFNAPKFLVPLREAELIKFVDNTWHALKVAYANEVGRVCRALDIDSSTVHEIFKSDTKLNLSAYYTRPGGAFGGSCLPKDVRAFQSIAASKGMPCAVMDAIIKSNEEHKEFQFKRVSGRVAKGDRVLLVGLAFKANTDDLRESPNLDLARRLVGMGADLSIYDPAVDPKQLMGQNLGFAFGRLPELGRMLVNREQATAGSYNLVVLANRVLGEAWRGKSNVIDISIIPARDHASVH